MKEKYFIELLSYQPRKINHEIKNNLNLSSGKKKREREKRLS